jgi:hypothetical protein
VAARLSGSAPGAWTSVALGGSSEFIGSVDLYVLDQGNCRPFTRRNRACDSCPRLIEPAERPAKIKGVHSSFPVVIGLANFWAMVAANLGLWAASVADAGGIWGAERHALTVGFLSTMVFAIGQRILPAFSGMRLLFVRN